MTYYLFKLCFLTSVHFGDSVSAVSLSSSQMTFCADRLFSLLCQMAVKKDCEGPEKLANLVREGKLKLSDAFPWKGENLYFPRPCLEAKTVRENDASDRKTMKKVAYLPLKQYPAFLRSLNGEEPVDPKTLLVRFGQKMVVTRAAVTDGQDTQPYAVGQFTFDEDCGLYFFAGVENSGDAEKLYDLLRQAGYGGIGGKVSSGYGNFTVKAFCPVTELDDVQASLLAENLDATNADFWVSLTTSLPQDEELEQALDGALYQLVRRGGFAQTVGLKGPEKKREQFFLTAGSTFRNSYRGDLFDVAPEGCPHPVYRYAVPIFLGVNSTWLTKL